MLRSVRTVIVDEIHAVAGNKRGSHLALTLERLAHVADGPVQRVGLSATQRPIETVARLLVGSGPDRDHPDGSPRCAIVDSGHRRQLDLALELPDDELGAVPTTEQMAQILDLIAGHVTGHRTTLVFVNTRSMAERIAHQLGERLGDELGANVAAHHGSLSRGRRQRVEARLRAGDLRALVATASLELGIDIGPVELVCQIGSPRSFATFLQRVGRSNHTRTGTPAGRLYPTTRDELVECAALMRGVQHGRLDAIRVPVQPLDILAQQMVAESAAEPWGERGPARPGQAGGAVPGPGRRGLRGHHRPAGRGHPHRPRPPRLLPAPGPGKPDGQGPPRGPAGRADLGRGHPRAGRFPGHSRAGGGPHRHRPRGVGGGEPAGRRVPARHPLLADPPGGAGHGPGGGRAGRAALGAALAGRGAGADPGAVRGGLGAAPGRGRPGAGRGPGLAAGRMRDRASRGRHHRGLPAGRAGRARRPADHERDHPGALLRRGRWHAADRACAVRRPGEPGVRAGPAQAVLRHVRLRAAGGGQRQRHLAVTRPAAQLPAGPGAEVPGVRQPSSRSSGRRC